MKTSTSQYVMRDLHNNGTSETWQDAKAFIAWALMGAGVIAMILAIV